MWACASMTPQGSISLHLVQPIARWPASRACQWNSIIDFIMEYFEAKHLTPVKSAKNVQPQQTDTELGYTGVKRC